MGLEYLPHLLTVLGASVGLAIVSQAFGYAFLYRDPAYKRLRKKMEDDSVKYNEAKRLADTNPNNKQMAKRAKNLENQLRALAGEMSGLQVKSNFANAFTLMGGLYGMSYYFDGVVVGRLPFQPIELFTSITHRGIEGDDYLDCSYIFLYVMLSMSVRPLISKIVNEEPKNLAEPAANPLLSRLNG
eukprot:Clim_evm107s25 gene=Clim_evmTU107s25